MKVFCNGFNLYGQLNFNSEPLIDNFTLTFTDKNMKNIYIAYSFVLLQFDDKLLFYNNYNSCSAIEINLPNGESVKQISHNDEMIIILSEKGNLFKAHIESIASLKKIDLSILENDEILIISSSAVLTLIYSKMGLFYAFKNDLIEKLDIKMEDVVDIKSGREHCLLLNKMGVVFSCGMASRGQGGNGDLQYDYTPDKVKALEGIKIEQIEAGGWHCCAISNTGDIYMWGWNCCQQIGIDSVEQQVVVEPIAIPFDDSNVVKAACGLKHTLVLLDNGEVFGFGWNKYKQLKKDAQEICKIKNLDLPKDERIVDIKCGPLNSILIYN